MPESPSATPCVLVIADPGSIVELVGALSEPLPTTVVSKIEVLSCGGGDEAIELFEARKPHVAVVTATLEMGDAQSLVDAVRGMLPRGEVGIVVIGDPEGGAIRNAADASHLVPDRFVSRPMAPRTLRFAVASALEAVITARAGQPPLPPLPAPPPKKLEAAAAAAAPAALGAAPAAVALIPAIPAPAASGKPAAVAPIPVMAAPAASVKPAAAAPSAALAAVAPVAVAPSAAPATAAPAAPAAPEDATREALRRRWAALADSMADPDEPAAEDAASKRSAQRERWAALADSMADSDEPADEAAPSDEAAPLLPPPIASRAPASSAPDAMALPQAWKPGTTAALPETPWASGTAEVPVREPTLIIRDPSEMAPPPEPLPLAVLIDRGMALDPSRLEGGAAAGAGAPAARSGEVRVGPGVGVGDGVQLESQRTARGDAQAARPSVDAGWGEATAKASINAASDAIAQVSADVTRDATAKLRADAARAATAQVSAAPARAAEPAAKPAAADARAAEPAAKLAAEPAAMPAADASRAAEPVARPAAADMSRAAELAARPAADASRPATPAAEPSADPDRTARVRGPAPARAAQSGPISTPRTHPGVPAGPTPAPRREDTRTPPGGVPILTRTPGTAPAPSRPGTGPIPRGSGVPAGELAPSGSRGTRSGGIGLPDLTADPSAALLRPSVRNDLDLPLDDLVLAGGPRAPEARLEVLAETPDESPAAPSSTADGRDFARQLRAKMSKMAERLFQGADAPAPAPADLAPRHDHSTEIDLSSLGEEPPLSGMGEGMGELEARAGARAAIPPELVTAPGSWDSQVRERGLPDQGEIVRGVSDAAMLLAKMFASGSTGRISFRRGEVETVVYFDQGRPVFASSSETRDRMGELLVREGKITAAQYERCQSVVAESGRRMGEILVDLGYLKRRELLPAVRRHVEDLVYALFGWDAGRYQIFIEAQPSAERIRLSRHPASLILEGIRRKLNRTTLERLVGPPSTVIDVPDRERLGGIINMGDLTSEERAALAAFDGQADLSAVARAAGIDVADVLPLAWGLSVIGLATARRPDTEIHDEGAALVGETDLAIDRERVRARWQLVTEADYFALIGVRRDATAFEIRRAYQAARRDFAADGFPPDLRRELARELDDIASVLDEAFHVLRDDRLRQTYLANLIE